jgi:D-hexose-6-phosphate mutarotase
MVKGDQQDMLRYMESVPHHGFAKDCVWDLIKTDHTKNNYDWLNIEEDRTKSCQDGPSQASLRLSPVNVPADLGSSWLRV